MSTDGPGSHTEGVTPTRCRIESVYERWADGWVDRDSIAHDPERCTVSLRIQYLDSDTDFDSNKGTGWLFERSVVPVLCDTVLFERVTRCENSIPEDETTLWLSSVELENGSTVEFPFSQGTLRIHTSDDTCIVSTDDTGTAMNVWRILGSELQWPRRAR